MWIKPSLFLGHISIYSGKCLVIRPRSLSLIPLFCCLSPNIDSHQILLKFPYSAASFGNKKIMDTLDKILLFTHISAGFSSLVCFILPLLVRKGGNWHVKIGKLYVMMMWVVVFTAFILSIINFLEGSYVQAIFLGYLAILTANPLWYGIAVLKHGREVPKSFLKKRKVFELLVFVLAILNVAAFVYLKGEGPSILLLIFGLLGLTTAPTALGSLKRIAKKTDPMLDHIEGMITTGIAAYTAFFAFGGYRFLENLYIGNAVVLFWVTPGVIGGIAISRLKRKYRRKQIHSISTSTFSSSKTPSVVSTS